MVFFFLIVPNTNHHLVSSSSFSSHSFHDSFHGIHQPAFSSHPASKPISLPYSHYFQCFSLLNNSFQHLFIPYSVHPFYPFHSSTHTQILNPSHHVFSVYTSQVHIAPHFIQNTSPISSSEPIIRVQAPDKSIPFRLNTSLSTVVLRLSVTSYLCHLDIG